MRSAPIYRPAEYQVTKKEEAPCVYRNRVYVFAKRASVAKDAATLLPSCRTGRGKGDGVTRSGEWRIQWRNDEGRRSGKRTAGVVPINMAAREGVAGEAGEVSKTGGMEGWDREVVAERCGDVEDILASLQPCHADLEPPPRKNAITLSGGFRFFLPFTLPPTLSWTLSLILG